MIYSAAIFAWIGGSATAGGASFPTTGVLNGVCYTLVFWKSPAARRGFNVWYFLSFYVVLLSIFIFCYGRILNAMRRQAKVMASHSGTGGSSAAETQLKHSQAKIIKTMLLVSLLFVILWTPGFIFSLLLSEGKVMFQDLFFYVALVFGHLYNCANPFIYAVNFDPVKQVLLRLIPCERNAQPGSVAAT